MNKEQEEKKGPKCECGFQFSGPGEWRNCQQYRDLNFQYWNICPDCGREYPCD